MSQDDPNINVQILRNLREGDVIWVQVNQEVIADEDEEFLDTLREAILADLDLNVSVLITPSGLIDQIKSLHLTDLMNFHGLIEDLINQKVGQYDSTES